MTRTYIHTHPHPPAHTCICSNYRTHGGVIAVARTVVDLLTHFFPWSIDRLERERAHESGSAPIFVVGGGRAHHFIAGRPHPSGHGDDESLEADKFRVGGDQVVIVRDEATKLMLRARLPKLMVLTTLESKGLEFSDVCIFNFFSSSKLGKRI